MSKLFKNIKFSSMPDSLFSTAGDLIIKLQAPYSENEVNLMINPNVVSYEKGREGSGFSFGPTSVSRHSKETMILKFDFGKNNTQKIQVEDKNYEIKLMSINKINPLSFEFLIEEI